MDVRLINSLEKVFLDEQHLSAAPYNHTLALRGERVSFQVACYYADQLWNSRKTVKIEVDSPYETKIYSVKQTPVTFPVYPYSWDNDFLRRTPGLYPDVLMPLKGEFVLSGNQWRCIWVSIVVPKDALAGDTVIKLRVLSTEGDESVNAEATFTINVIPAELPAQTLKHTEWFHCDCLASHYGVEIFSEAHWDLINAFIKSATEYGVNMLLTPIFTPPLDTKIGSERPTVQLVEVSINNGKYHFGFEKLKRYIQVAQNAGIEYFEISHLFTQWGAKHAPKIMATVEGEFKKIFGWETDSHSDEYVTFLNIFLKELISWLKKNNLLGKCYFHISDEPNNLMIDDYRIAYESVADVLKDCNIIDALSDYSFYEKGIIKKPIPTNESIHTFIDNGVENLWVYYCCGQVNKVSNRMIAMPSYRNRILGYQLFKYNIEGFLQWGFNFYYTYLSTEIVNPWLDTTAGDAFPAGDSFLVYPGENGEPISSIRQVVLAESLQDLRALSLLEQWMAHDEIVSELEKFGDLTFTDYPRSSETVLNMRQRINELIQQHSRKFNE